MGRPQHRQRAICREEDFTFRSMRTDLRTSFVPEQLHHFLIPTASRYDVILFQLPLHSSSSLRCPHGAVHPPMHPTGCLGLTCAAGWRAQQEGWGRWKEAGRVSGLGRWGKSHPWLLPWHASCTQTCSSAAAMQRGRGWLWLWAGSRGCSLEQSNMGGVFAPEAGELRAEQSVRCFLIKLSYNAAVSRTL